MDHKLVTLNKKVHNIQFDNKYKETYWTIILQSLLLLCSQQNYTA